MGQLEHVDEPTVEYLPAGQFLQAPPDAEYCPALQFVHADAAVDPAGHDFPATHLEHDVAPIVVEYCPAGQLEHDVFPSLG